jgi:two-component system response regulator AtoC
LTLSHKILLVEDSRDLVELWQMMFRPAGFYVTACYDRGSALKLLESGEKFAAVISDYILPDGTGLELLDHFRAREPQAPFILVTGMKERSIDEHVRRAGHAAVLMKPVAFKTLLAKLKEHLP